MRYFILMAVLLSSSLWATTGKGENMNGNFDFKKEWERTKKQLVTFSRQATEVAKKGEKELVNFSQRSMLHIDATAASLQKEKLFYLIGKAYVKSLKTKGESAELDRLLKELNAVIKEESVLKKKIGDGASKKISS